VQVWPIVHAWLPQVQSGLSVQFVQFVHEPAVHPSPAVQAAGPAVQWAPSVHHGPVVQVGPEVQLVPRVQKAPAVQNSPIVQVEPPVQFGCKVQSCISVQTSDVQVPCVHSGESVQGTAPNVMSSRAIRSGFGARRASPACHTRLAIPCEEMAMICVNSGDASTSASGRAPAGEAMTRIAVAAAITMKPNLWRILVSFHLSSYVITDERTSGAA